MTQQKSLEGCGIMGPIHLQSKLQDFWLYVESVLLSDRDCLEVYSRKKCTMPQMCVLCLKTLTNGGVSTGVPAFAAFSESPPICLILSPRGDYIILLLLKISYSSNSACQNSGKFHLHHKIPSDYFIRHAQSTT